MTSTGEMSEHKPVLFAAFEAEMKPYFTTWKTPRPSRVEVTPAFFRKIKNYRAPAESSEWDRMGAIGRFDSIPVVVADTVPWPGWRLVFK